MAEQGGARSTVFRPQDKFKFNFIPMGSHWRILNRKWPDFMYVFKRPF